MLEVRCDDCIEGMAGLDADSVDAIVCDPPYSIAFMGRGWDSFDTPRRFQEWCRDWACEAFRVLRPGGHLLAFGGSRTYHRLAAGVEDAGFDVRDQLMWLYGQGFPKSLDVSQAIDEKLGGEREVVGERRIGRLAVAPGQGEDRSAVSVSVPATAEAEKWAGWGTALKPAHEPLVLARKPLSGTVAETVLEHGTGALNIDASKVGTTGGATAVAGTRTTNPDGATDFPGRAEMVPSGGRWPSNVLLGHHPDCRGYGTKRSAELCHPDCPARMLDEQSGEPVARFFYCAKAATKERIAGVERSLHPTVKPVTLMQWLVRLVTPPGGLVLDPFAGSGTTGVACVLEGFDFLGYDQDETYARQAAERIADYAFTRGRKLTSPPPSATTPPSRESRFDATPDNPEEGHDDEGKERTRSTDRSAARERRPDEGQGRDRRGGQAGAGDEGQDADGDARRDDLHGGEEGRGVPGAGARRRRAGRGAAGRDDAGGRSGGAGRDESGSDARVGRRPRGRGEAGSEAAEGGEAQSPQAEDGSDRLASARQAPEDTPPAPLVVEEEH